MYLNFVCRPSKKLKDGLNPLELVITIDGQRKTISLGRRISAKAFNPKLQQVRKDAETNKFIETIRYRFYSIETEMIQRNMSITPESVVQVFRNGFPDENISLLTVFKKHNAETSDKVKQGLIVEATYKKYEVTQRYLVSFLRHKLHKSDILIAQVTPSFVEQFYVYLTAYMDINTAIHKMKSLKKVFRYAQEEGYIKAMPFKIRMTQKNLEYTPLTIDELRRIKEKDFGVERLNQVRDVFIFACYSGLAFSDLKSLCKADMRIDEDGKAWIIKARHKTRVISQIPLMNITQEIWEKYDFKLPVLSNQKYNGYLKEIADICGIKKKLHSHLARHTFATILLNNGMDILSVSKILGHSNSRITEKVYAKMMPKTLGDKVEEISDRIV